MLNLIVFTLIIAAVIVAIIGLRKDYLYYKYSQRQIKLLESQLKEVLDECYAKTKDEKLLSIRDKYTSG